ncbi:hypothetical protein D3C78_1119090 [compost metagenome]
MVEGQSLRVHVELKGVSVALRPDIPLVHYTFASGSAECYIHNSRVSFEGESLQVKHDRELGFLSHFESPSYIGGSQCLGRSILGDADREVSALVPRQRNLA